MKILLTADPELPVPPKLYGGIERIVDLLVLGLQNRGHEVGIVAHPESTSPASKYFLGGSCDREAGLTHFRKSRFLSFMIQFRKHYVGFVNAFFVPTT